MNIKEEYIRLTALTETPEKWQEVEDAWHIAMNYEKRDGSWYKKSSSSGDLVAGFAIDPVTEEFEVGVPGCDHGSPKWALIDRLGENLGTFVEKVAIADRVVEGRAAFVEGWEFPFIILWAPQDDETKAKLEEMVIRREAGLPMWKLYHIAIEKRKEEKEKPSRKKAKSRKKKK